MPIHIDELTSEIVPDATAPAASGGAASEEAQAWTRTLEQLATLVADRRRVAAEGFDD